MLMDGESLKFIESLDDGILLLDADGKASRFNERFASMTGLSKAEIKGKPLSRIRGVSALADAVKGGQVDWKHSSRRIAMNGRLLQASLKAAGANGNDIFVILKDFTEIANLEEDLLRKNAELMVVNSLASVFMSSSDTEAVFGELISNVLVVTDLNMGWIALKTEAGYEIKASEGVSRGLSEKLGTGALNGFHDAVSATREPIYIADDRVSIPAGLYEEGFRFLSGLPLRSGEHELGVLIIGSRAGVRFDFSMASMLSVIGKNLSLIAEKLRLFREAERLAVTDGLTGLYNTRYFYAALDAEAARAGRYGEPFSVMLFDLDDFKAVNDTYGHQAGDEVLKAIGRIFGEAKRKSDTLARYGGEEFMVLLPNTPKHEAIEMGRRMIKLVADERFLFTEGISVTASGGVASFPDDAEDPKALLYAADIAMYKAKEAGKKQVMGFKTL